MQNFEGGGGGGAGCSSILVFNAFYLKKRRKPYFLFRKSAMNYLTNCFARQAFKKIYSDKHGFSK